uniref:HTH cro/C1-type domain-containing protein n=1 Tax=Cyprinus carpio carpio TaxID=630221 RepID=A0A9J8CXR7_CYPCA
MGKTADLTAVQKAIIDTLKREGKTQKEISERIGCSQSAVSRHLSGKSVGRKKCGKKRCTTRRGDRTLRKIVEKDRFQTLGDLRKQWTESGVETSRATVHRRVLLNQKQRQKRLTWATEKQHWTVAQWSKVLFRMKANFCMSFGNQGARVWRKTGEKEMPKCLTRVLGLASLNFLFTISHRFSMGFRSGELAGQLSTVIPWSVNHLPVVLAL